MLGTSPDAIDLAEDRGKFAEILAELEIPAPPRGEARTIEAREVARRIGYPVVVRPSYVLGGRAMEIVYDDEELGTFVRTAAAASPDHPVLVDRFLEGAIQVDVGAVADATGDVFVGGVMGTSRKPGCTRRFRRLPDPACDALRRGARHDRRHHAHDRPAPRGGGPAEPAARGEGRTHLGDRGEPSCLADSAVRLRGDRRLPGPGRDVVLTRAKQLAELAAEGAVPADPHHYRHLSHTSVKAAVLPFGRFPGVDTVLGPEMKSTGEVMVDADSGMALAKAMVAAGHALPTGGTVFVSVANRDKRAIMFPAKRHWRTSGSGSWRPAGPRGSCSAPGSPSSRSRR